MQSEEKKLATKSWRNDLWLQRPDVNGYLTPENVLDYFCNTSNPFYDKTCVNEMVKMQRLTFTNIQQAIKEKEGRKYVLQYAKEPHLYVIAQEEKRTSDETVLLNIYYIIGGTVFMAPTLMDVISSRMYNCLYSLNKTFQEIRNCAKFSHLTGQYHWDFEHLQQHKLSKKQKDHKKKEKEIAQKAFWVESKPPYPRDLHNHINHLLANIDKETYNMVQKKQQETSDEISTISDKSKQTAKAEPASLKRSRSSLFTSQDSVDEKDITQEKIEPSAKKKRVARS